MAIMQKYKADQVNVYAVRLDFFTREKLEKIDKKFAREKRDYDCYKCGHEFDQSEMISLAFVNKGGGNKLVCQTCGLKLIESDDVFSTREREKGSE